MTLRAATSAGLVEGTLHVARLHLLLDAINHGHDFVTLTDVRVRDANERVPFFALRRSETLAVVVPAGEDPDDRKQRPSLVDHEVTCLLPSGAVRGRVALVKDVRLSDWLAGQRGFIVMRESRLWLGANGLSEDQAAVVLVNSQRVVGVTELG